jgi:hypothetical protein
MIFLSLDSDTCILRDQRVLMTYLLHNTVLTDVHIKMRLTLRLHFTNFSNTVSVLISVWTVAFICWRKPRKITVNKPRRDSSYGICSYLMENLEKRWLESTARIEIKQSEKKSFIKVHLKYWALRNVTIWQIVVEKLLLPFIFFPQLHRVSWYYRFFYLSNWCKTRLL